jgi:hypothetical protein
MSDTTIDYGRSAQILREVQTELRTVRMQLDLLRRRRERDLALFATHDDLRDWVGVLAQQLADADQRVEQSLNGVREANQRIETMLADIGKRLRP